MTAFLPERMRAVNEAEAIAAVERTYSYGDLLERVGLRDKSAQPGRRIRNTLLRTFSHGGTLVTVAERSPDSVLAAMAQHRVQILPTTPTFLNTLLITYGRGASWK